MRILVTALVLLVSLNASAQFRTPATGEPGVADGLIRPVPPSLLFGWFNPDRFHMRHTFSLSYVTMAGQGLSLGTYTNSMQYEFADNLNARADLSFTYSPYSSFSTFGAQDLSGITLSRAQVNYRPWENLSVHLQYRRDPYRWLSPWDSPWSSPWYRESDF